MSYMIKAIIISVYLAFMSVCCRALAKDVLPVTIDDYISGIKVGDYGLELAFCLGDVRKTCVFEAGDVDINVFAIGSELQNSAEKIVLDLSHFRIAEIKKDMIASEMSKRAPGIRSDNNSLIKRPSDSMPEQVRR